MTDKTPSAAPADEYRGCSTCEHKRLAAWREPCLSCATGDSYGWEPATLAATPAPAPASVKESLTVAPAPAVPPYPAGDVVGPCVCGSWPGGPCLKCPQIESPVAAPVAPNLRPVISWLQNGCDPKAAAEELQRYQDRLDAAPQAPAQALAAAGGTAPEMADVPRRQPDICDTHCTWLDHAPGCERAELTDEQIAEIYGAWSDAPGTSYADLIRSAIAFDRRIRGAGMAGEIQRLREVLSAANGCHRGAGR